MGSPGKGTFEDVPRLASEPPCARPLRLGHPLDQGTSTSSPIPSPVTASAPTLQSLPPADKCSSAFSAMPPTARAKQKGSILQARSTPGAPCNTFNSIECTLPLVEVKPERVRVPRHASPALVNPTSTAAAAVYHSVPIPVPPAKPAHSSSTNRRSLSIPESIARKSTFARSCRCFVCYLREDT